MSGFLLGLLVGAWAGFLFGMVFLAAWINVKRGDDYARSEDDLPTVAQIQKILTGPCPACGGVGSRGVILHVPGCSQQSPVRQAFL